MNTEKQARRAFETGVIFVSATCAQFFVPFPLNLFLVPAIASAWWFSSGFESAAMDYAYENREIVLTTGKTYVNSLLEKCKRGHKEYPQTPENIEEGDVFDESM